MEVDPNRDELGVLEGMEIVPPPCKYMGVFMLATLIMDAMLLAVVIEGKDQFKPRLEGLLVGVLKYNKTSG